MFYQYLPGSNKWDFGLMWGHAVSFDQVHWKHLPPALQPTPGGADQDGVFSGWVHTMRNTLVSAPSHALPHDACMRWQPPTPWLPLPLSAVRRCACIDEETGLPVLLYTGVRLRSSPSCGPLPPPEYDLNMPFIESQLLAFPADPGEHKHKSASNQAAFSRKGKDQGNAWGRPASISKQSQRREARAHLRVSSKPGSRWALKEGASASLCSSHEQTTPCSRSG
jgi:hypothetical protein